VNEADSVFPAIQNDFSVCAICGSEIFWWSLFSSIFDCGN